MKVALQENRKHSAPIPSAALAAMLALVLAVGGAPSAAAQNNLATGTPGISDPDSTNLGIVGPNEDSTLTAVQGTIMDTDGITTFTATWVWSQGDSKTGDFTTLETDASAASASFTPRQSHVGKFLRVCAQFSDDDGTSEERCWTSFARVRNVNDVPSGGPSYISDGGTYTSGNGNIVATEGQILTMGVDLDPRRIQNLTDGDGISDPVFLWQWHRAPTASNAETLTDNDDPSASGWPIAGANSNTWTPTNADVGNILVACVRYIDDFGAAERACTSMQQTVGVNSPPTGRIAIQPHLSQLSGITAPPRTNASFTTVVQGVRYTMADTTHGGNLADADGLPTGSGRYTAGNEGISWQSGTSANGPWTERDKDSDSINNGYIPDAGDAAAGWMRVCLFYEDEQGTVEGGDSTSAATRALADSDSTCSPAATVQNVNDAPTANSSSIGAPMGGSYTFNLADFTYTDPDGDDLTDIIIAAALFNAGGNPGTLLLSNAAVTVGQAIPVAQIEAGNLVWTPPPACHRRCPVCQFHIPGAR